MFDIISRVQFRKAPEYRTMQFVAVTNGPIIGIVFVIFIKTFTHLESPNPASGTGVRVEMFIMNEVCDMNGKVDGRTFSFVYFIRIHRPIYYKNNKMVLLTEIICLRFALL